MAFDNGTIFRVVLQANAASSGNTQVNVWHYDAVDGAPAESKNDGQALADFFRDNVVPKVATCIDNRWAVQPVIVTEEKDPKNPNAPRQQWTSGGVVTGTLVHSGDRVHDAYCMECKVLTEHIGKRFRGRKWPIMTAYEEHNLSGVWDATMLAFVQAYLDSVPRQPDVAAGLSSAVCNLVVYSRTQRADPLAASLPYTSKVTQLVLHQEAHWLRSRAKAGDIF